MTRKHKGCLEECWSRVLPLTRSYGCSALQIILCVHAPSQSIHTIDGRSYQYPQDMFAMQELTWPIKSNLIIKTGITQSGAWA